MAYEPTVTTHLPHDGPAGAVVTTEELRRYLRTASTLLAVTPAAPLERVRVLQQARGWSRAVAEGIEQLLREAERELGDTLDEPLTGPAHLDRIQVEP